MLKVKNNTKYAPYNINDLSCRSGDVGMTSFIDSNLKSSINNEWIYYITQSASYKYDYNESFDTDLISAYIYDNFKTRVMLDKYQDLFDGWDELTDFDYYCDAVKNTVSNTLITNAEKYNKLYFTMFAEFNPMWNVDGDEITERTLTQSGTRENAKTGTEATERESSITDNETLTSETTKTGTETTAKTGTETDATTGTEATAKTGTDIVSDQKTTYDSSTFYDTEKETTTHNTTDTLTHNTTDTLTHNTTDTLTHNTTDNREDTKEVSTGEEETSTLTHNTKDKETRNLQDVERIHIKRQGNIGVVSTVRLLQEYQELGNLNLIDIIARDIVNSITFMTY